MTPFSQKWRLSGKEYIEGVRSGNRFILSKAITLIESELSSDITIADQVLREIIPATGKAIRLGITGVPGVGKSTFIEALGTYLTQLNIPVAVLTIDPSSTKSGGSILGDKTRMPELSQHPLAFIRPSATGAHLGGVARKTREAILLCEAAGYQVTIVETVGVGQSETEVRDMVDFFLLLMLAGAGDELQGIKKGIIEMADALVINKADGGNIKNARKAKQDYEHALHLLPPAESGVAPAVFLSSATEKSGINEVWEFIRSFEQKTTSNQYLKKQRAQQNLQWFHKTLHSLLMGAINSNESIQAILPEVEEQVRQGKLPATQAAREIVSVIFPEY